MVGGSKCLPALPQGGAKAVYGWLKDAFGEVEQARSSVVEHYIDTVGVGSSSLPVPTSGTSFN